MTLADQYRRQLAWRDWKTALAACPIRPGQRVLDLGCGPGDVAKLLSEMGAKVTGVDGNAELLTVARAHCPEAEFIEQNIGHLQLDGNFEGLWCSFTAAYFPDFAGALAHWRKFLTPNAWVCFVEMDGLLDHEPLSESTQKRVEDFYAHSKSYDFHSGGKLGAALRRAGFRVRELELRDQELSASGLASQAVEQAWAQRLDRMRGLHDFFGTDFLAFRTEFLAALADPDHVSNCRVICAVGAPDRPVAHPSIGLPGAPS